MIWSGDTGSTDVHLSVSSAAYSHLPPPLPPTQESVTSGNWTPVNDRGSRYFIKTWLTALYGWPRETPCRRLVFLAPLKPAPPRYDR